jgi:hypothetical protein
LIDKLSFDDLTLEIWFKVIFRLKGIFDDEVRHRHNHRDRSCSIPFKSAILTDFSTIFEEFETKQLTLLYRDTEDSFECSTFHNKCDNQQASRYRVFGNLLVSRYPSGIE